MAIITNFKNSAGVDIASTLVEKSYLIDRYPELANTFRFAGLWTWGDNTKGALGNNSGITHRSSPIQTIAAGTNWKRVAGGGNFIAAIKTDGTLWTWGSSAFGTLGNNTSGGTALQSSPVQTVAGGTNWKQVSCAMSNDSAMAAIKTDGTLWLWGRNAYGQLGDNTIVAKSSPIQTIAGGTNWKMVSCGGYHTSSIKTDGTIWSWGKGNSGQLGNNATSTTSSPVQTVAGGTNWRLIAAGNEHSAAIKTDGTLWVWGRNNNGQLGNNTVTSQQSPVQTISGGTNWKMVAAGGYHIAATKTDGTLWLWGRSSYGQLGVNDRTHRSSPVQTIASGTNWKLVSAGIYHTSCIKTDGTLWLWGRGDRGQLGDDQTSNRSSPVQTIAGGTNWKSVDNHGNFLSVAIRDDSSDEI